MKSILLAFLVVSLLVCSCSQKEKKAQIMQMSGYVETVSNEKNIQCTKGDTVILSNCGKGEFKISIYGLYTGRLQETIVWYNKDGSVKSFCKFEKAVFLRDL